MTRLLTCFSLVLALGTASFGCATTQSTDLNETAADKKQGPHPGFLKQYAATYRFRLGKPSRISVTPDEQSVLFLRSGARSKVGGLYEFDLKSKKERTLLTAKQILGGSQEKLSAEELARRERQRQTARGIATYQLSRDGQTLLVPLSGSLFLVSRSTQKVRELKGAKGYPIDARFSPDGQSLSCVRDGDLYVFDVQSGKERRLTTRPNPQVSHATAEFVAQEEMGRYRGYWWSPDSQWLAYQKTDVKGVETLSILDPAHPEKTPRAQAYPRPGKTNAKVRLGLMSVKGGKTTWVEWDGQRYPYLATVRWDKHGPLLLVVQNRAQTEHAVLSVDSKTGSTRTLHIEKDVAWINLDQSVPRWLQGGKAFLWSTERGGTPQLEVRGADGTLKASLLPSDLTYMSVLGVDHKRDHVYVRATATPTQAHVFRLSLNQKKPLQLSQEPGVHTAVFSEGFGTRVQVAQTRSGAHQWSVRDHSGSPLGALASKAEAPPFKPNLEWTVAGDKKQFKSLIIRPRHFEEGQKYPVIVYVYGGPHYRVVKEVPGRYLIQQWLADHGYIVVMADGRGTPGQGRVWERSIKGEVSTPALEDQVAALKSLGAQYPEMDMDRVGVYGWSFGGYMTAMMVMRHPELYKVGVSGAPVADWHDYDTHYTERYMGMPGPNAKGYAKASVLTWAKDLIRPLLIIHGTVDDNVYFMHAIKMSDALFKAGRDHVVLPLSGATHMVAGENGLQRLYGRILGFFQKALRP